MGPTTLSALWIPTVIAFCTLETHAQTSITSTKQISLPTARPNGAYNVPGNFPGVGFELAFVPGYNNEFSDTMIQNLANRMDEKPIIRIGGTSGDIFSYNPTQKEPVICPGNPDVNQCGVGTKFIIGPSYFDGIKNFFKAAKFSIQAPLGPIHSAGPPNKTNVVDFIKQAYTAIGQNRLDAIALGNEVNFFEANATAYVKDALAAAGDIQGAVDTGSDKIWEILDTASSSVQGPGSKYTVQQVFDAGINKGGKVKYVAEHYYQFDGKALGITEHLLNHTDVKVNFAHHKPSINYTLHEAKMGYVLSEVGGALNAQIAENTYFANTLWAVNLEMYAMSNGVQRLNLAQRPVVNRALWTPPGVSSDMPAMVRAAWYAMPFLTNFIGKGVSGKRGAVNLGLDDPVFTAYAMYEGDTMARIAVVNLQQYNGEGARKGVKVHLQGLAGLANKTVHVGVLHANAGTAAGGWDVNKKNITWEGQQWSYQVDKGRGHGKVSRKEIPVNDGSVEVDVHDSEAIIVYLK